MADYLDPSPRASKRRRTTTYKVTRSILENNEGEDLDGERTAAPVDGHSKLLDDFGDSTYGSKEVSLVEDDEPKLTSVHDVNVIDLEDSEISQNERERKSQEDGTIETTTPMSDGSASDEETITVQPRSSGRERKRPRRYSISPDKPKSRKPTLAVAAEKRSKTSNIDGSIKSTGTRTPKGILTPTRREKRTGPRKSVLFDQAEQDIEEKFGFKDINSSRDGRLSTKSPKTRIGTSKSLPLDIDEELPLTPSKKARRKPEANSVHDAPLQSEPDLDDLMISTDLYETSVGAVPITPMEGKTGELSIDDDPAILAIKSTILSRVTRQGTTTISSHLQTQYDTLHSLLHSTITSGESNSLLLLGARGTGKSHLLETAISDLSTKYSDVFHTVRLNGFYQTDDKLALREIWRQLGREMQVEEMESGELGGSYADTMSSLLSLLSHPDEFMEAVVDGDDVMQSDTGVRRTSKSVLFVLDEFDLFTTHPRQTLLYNLFDIAQSKKAPIAVVGCSTRMDVVDCLEKRVKSRFSHRWLHIPSAKTLTGFEEIVQNILIIGEEESIAMFKTPAEHLKQRSRWNEYIKSSFLPSLQVQKLIERIFYTTKSIPDMLAEFYIPIATLRLPEERSGLHALPAITDSTNSPSLFMLLPRLSTLHLALLIAASRLDTIHNLTTLNFNLVYAHYLELISRNKLHATASGAVVMGAASRQWKRETAQAAWEDLGLYECLIPVSGVVNGTGAGALSKDGGFGGGDSVGGEGASVRMWRVDVTLDELGWAIKEKWSTGVGLRDVFWKWCREI